MQEKTGGLILYCTKLAIAWWNQTVEPIVVAMQGCSFVLLILCVMNGHQIIFLQLEMHCKP